MEELKLLKYPYYPNKWNVIPIKISMAFFHRNWMCLVAQSCLTLCDSMDYSPPALGGSSGKNTGVGCHALLQQIFPTAVSHIAGRFFTDWATRKAPEIE